MRRDAANTQTAPYSKRPGDVMPGDVVVLDGAPFEVLTEPFLGMTGASVFDTRALFWRAQVQALDGARRTMAYATWAVNEHVTVRGPQRA